MGIVTLVILIFLLPYVWFLWTGISNKTGMMERYRWKKPLATLLLLVIISAALNCFYSNAYQLAFFQNGVELMVGLIVAGAFLVILSIINIIVGIVYKKRPQIVPQPESGLDSFNVPVCHDPVFHRLGLSFGGKSIVYHTARVSDCRCK
ncbi:hypothetical protein [Planococcus citreus]|uniref:hypothetical protein n=1 Tax=Planococcus citreus TaxID=1373 RepID=UPI00108048F0|nr:hypothetical protein [Planococcus citreus]